MIEVERLSKKYLISNKNPGFSGTIKHFLKRKTYELDAVSDLSFVIKPGEIVGFLGANGAGKTTTLKMLCGLIHPTSGLVRVVGHIPQKRKPAFLNQITLVMGQKQQLLWDLPPLDSLKVNAAIYGISSLEAKKRINELAEMLEIGKELTRPVRKLSLGQRMKAELLAALLHRPSILFLDEPTLGLDVNAQAKVRRFLVEYNRQTGATILLSSHYMTDITTLCPRVLLIHKGKLFHDGDLDALTETLSPYRQVRLEVKQRVREQDFADFGKLEFLEGRAVCLLVNRRELPSVVTSLLAKFDVLDLEVSDPPIDELIGKLFRQGSM